MEERIGDRIATLQRERGYTQKELASMVGVTEAAMSRYIKNEREPRLEVIANLATALNTTSDYLITGREEQPESYGDIMNLVARGHANWSKEEKYKLIKVLFDDGI